MGLHREESSLKVRGAERGIIMFVDMTFAVRPHRRLMGKTVIAEIGENGSPNSAKSLLLNLSLRRAHL